MTRKCEAVRWTETWSGRTAALINSWFDIDHNGRIWWDPNKTNRNCDESEVKALALFVLHTCSWLGWWCVHGPASPVSSQVTWCWVMVRIGPLWDRCVPWILHVRSGTFCSSTCWKNTLHPDSSCIVSPRYHGNQTSRGLSWWPPDRNILPRGGINWLLGGEDFFFLSSTRSETRSEINREKQWIILLPDSSNITVIKFLKTHLNLFRVKMFGSCRIVLLSLFLWNLSLTVC